MDMKKTVKKMSAFVAGGFLLGATVMGAMAYDLSNYPSPFVKDGFFQGKIVVGAIAMPSDVIGATDIAASLQAASVTPVSTTGTSTVSESFTNGYKFSESKDLIFGNGLADVNTVVTDTELPKLLAHQTVQNDAGTTFEYDQEIDVPAGTVVNADVSQYSLNDKYTEPVLYYDLGSAPFYTAVADFKDKWSASDFVNSESIELFGQVFTFDPSNTNTKDTLTLYGTQSQVYIEKGQTAKVTYNGVDYTVEVLGGNSNAGTQGSAIVKVGTETKSMTQGQSKTVGGLPIFVKDVFISNVGGDNVAVQLFIGSNKIELESGTNGQVKLNGKVLDEVTVTTLGSTWANITKMSFTVTPKDAATETQYLLSGKDYIDPLFGSFKFHFTGASDLKAGKEEFKLSRSGKKLNVEFTPKGATSSTVVTVLEDNATFYEHFYANTTLLNLKQDDTFLYTENVGDAKKAVTHLLKISRVRYGNDSENTNFEVRVDDSSFGKTYTMTRTTDEMDSKIALYLKEGSDADHISFSNTSSGGVVAYDPVIYSGTEAKIEFLKNTTDVIGTAADILKSTGYMLLTEDPQLNKDTATDGTVVLKYAWNAADNDFDVSVQSKSASFTNTTSSSLGDNNNVDYFMSEFGTYMTVDTDKNTNVDVFVPTKEIHYDMWLAPIASSAVVSGSPTGGSYTINPFQVGAAVLDKDAMNLIGTTPLIVVGGPLVNTVAMQLMGNPTAAQINTMFQAGTATIKLYPTQNAILVAGYNAQDTLGASYVLAKYGQYALTGNEVQVLVPSLSSITVKTVTP